MQLPFGQLKQFIDSVVADYNHTRHLGSKYQGQEHAASSLPVDAVRKIGLQMMIIVRLMQSVDKMSVPLVPQAISRLIRHLYGAEIHWKSTIAPGVTIVHGNGLVISHAAKIGSRCLLFQNVTLGQSVDPITREVGAPILGNDVHIGPGATLIGPITVGDRTKIMAGAVLTQSVPPDSLVRPADSLVSARRSATANHSNQET